MKETVASSNSALVPSTPAGSRRPRATSMQHFSELCSVPRECCSSGSFVSKLFRMVDTEPSSIVSWCRDGSAFCIVDPKMMADHCLPKYFRHRRFSSLIRQLNFYSFYRVQEGQLTIYQHSFFRKGRPDLLLHIKRRGAGKAKDPWFDPLANSSNKTPNSMVNSPLKNVMQTPTMAPTPFGLTACYSPMAKSITLDNMSPALKPAMVQACLPSVELNSSGMNDGPSKIDTDHACPLPSALSMKNEMLFGDMLDSSLTKAASSLSAPLDIDIQDFLTDDCSITSGQADDPLCGANQNKFAMVSRNCLKLDNLQHLELSPTLESQGDSESISFENGLLMGLANVEPGTWEVPLSPLNDEEDVMPWLDLCF
ncbi:hypothetical protein CCR75_008343 [Bremia lactucae]|uniref:HSF-type DNA-binding domain-containing protein n=1 Tax=Bremia lactucae TaxID=4779 RepID=A0A976IFN1_BRELC|nr:hypothetical protein CCR75_008343 [Bremia lactucae]